MQFGQARFNSARFGYRFVLNGASGTVATAAACSRAPVVYARAVSGILTTASSANGLRIRLNAAAGIITNTAAVDGIRIRLNRFTGSREYQQADASALVRPNPWLRGQRPHDLPRP